MKKESMGHNGWVHYELKDKYGNVKEVSDVPNLIVNSGKAAMAGLLLVDVAVDAFDWIALGTGSTAPAAGNTALESEITTNGGARINATGTRVTTDVTNDTSQLEAEFTFTGDLAITESGVFNAGSGGVMLCRQIRPVINVEDGDTMTMNWKIKHS